MKPINAAEFIEENIKTIFAYSLSRVSDKDDAEDLTNDIVTAILQSADRIKNQDAFYGYVWKIAANTYKKFLQKKSRCQSEVLNDNLPDDGDFTETILKWEDVVRLRREIALLSEEYRECTIAYYYDGLSCADISKKLGVSLEMVKYYLFKTRKILKEGVSMEREFGERSFNPAPFTFATIFSGNYNSEYRNMFSRKLPGQILLATYYTPMSVRELAVELGVASVYLEDEIDLLEKYNLITLLPSRKYQTNLVIFTEDFTNEFYGKAEIFAPDVLEKIITGVKEKLPSLRNVNSFCKKLSDKRLLWGLLWFVMCQGHGVFEDKYPQHKDGDKLYDGATGSNFGIADNNIAKVCGCTACTGGAHIDGNFCIAAADFDILPEKNKWAHVSRKSLSKKIYKIISGEIEPEFMILTEEQEVMISELLNDEISLMTALYDELFLLACQAMHVHAPKNVEMSSNRVVFQTLFFRTAGLIGYCVVKSGALQLPEFDGPAAMYIRSMH